MPTVDGYSVKTAFVLLFLLRMQFAKMAATQKSIGRINSTPAKCWLMFINSLLTFIVDTKL